MIHRLITTLSILLALACGREVVFVEPPPPASEDGSIDTTTTDTTTVQRVSLTVTVRVDRRDSAVAVRIGLVNGRLSDAKVSARRVEGQQGLQTGMTDSLGQLTLVDLIPGTWAITALRPLSEVERESLDSANGDVTGFAGAGQFEVSDSATEATVEAVAGRQGTLVISEAHIPVDNEVTGYALAQYIEVHNNSFDTLFLDGKILGMAMSKVRELPSPQTCSEMERWREDAEGIWTRLFWAFPGSGTEYPLPPMSSAVVATDAIDHRVIRPELLDLSDADFEFIGASDVDNPAVPNMHNFPGWSDTGSPTGHGPRWVTQISIFLAESVEPDSLPTDYVPARIHLRIPGNRILDVLTSGAMSEIGSTYCANFVHPTFDGRFAELVDPTSLTYSLVRRPVAAGPAELGLLQRTKVSAVDFVRGSPSPGRAP